MVQGTSPSLLERLRDGAEPLAWEEFIAIYHRPMYALARKRGCSDATAMDAVHDAVVAVFENIAVFQYDPSRGRFLSWLFGVVDQKIAHLRRRQRPEVGLPDHAAHVPDPASDGPEAALEREFERSLWGAVLDVVRRSVEPRTYQAFELVVIHQMSTEDVMAATGLETPAAVYSAKRRVVAQMMELSQGYRDSGDLDTTLREAVEAMRSDVRLKLTAAVATTLDSRSEDLRGRNQR